MQLALEEEGLALGDRTAPTAHDAATGAKL
jgi:hypothetical protein